MLGNHDFDGGVSHVIEYLEKMNTSVVMTNVDVSKETRWPVNKNLFSNSLTLDVGGEKIGVCGYVLKSTPRYTLDDLRFSFHKIPFYILQEHSDSVLLENKFLEFMICRKCDFGIYSTSHHEVSVML